MRKGFLLVSLAILAVVMVPQVTAAECLLQGEEDALIAIALANNQSPSLFINIFDKICDRAYTKNESDAVITDFEEDLNFTGKLDAFEDRMENYVENEVENYTNWVEGQLDIRQYLEDMVTIMNASSSIEEFDSKLDAAEQKAIDQLDSQIQNFKQDYVTEWEVQQMLDEHQVISDSNPKAQALAGYEIPLIVGVVLIASLYLLRDNIRGTLPNRSAPENRSVLRAHTFGIPGINQIRKKGVEYEQRQQEPPPATNNGKRKGKKDDS